VGDEAKMPRNRLADGHRPEEGKVMGDKRELDNIAAPEGSWE